MTAPQQARAKVDSLIRLYMEECSCSGERPIVGDLKLESHRPDCRFLMILVKEERRLDAIRTLERS